MRKKKPPVHKPKTSRPPSAGHDPGVKRVRTLFGSLMANIPDLVYFKDQHGRFITASHSLAQFVGLSHPRQLVGKTDFDFFAAEHAQLAYDDEQAILRTGRPLVGKSEKEVFPDGRSHWVLTTKMPLRNARGKIIGTYGISKDITAQRLMEEELHRTQGLYNSLIEQLPAAIFRKDAAGRYVFVNSRFCSLKGMQADEILGRTLEEMIAYEKALPDPKPAAVLPWSGPPLEPAMDHHGLIMQTGQSIELEEAYHQPDGTVLYFHVLKSPVLAEAGRVVGSQGILFDITATKQAEAKLFQTQKMDTVGKLAGGFAHEFSSIMTAIIGQSELLQSDLPAGHPLLKNAAEIRSAADRAATLTRQLLAYGRKQILSPQTLSLNSVLANMENILRHLAGPKVELRLVPAPELKTVKADVGQIEQVIVNMVLNAVHAMPQGGRLTLETANVTHGPDYLRQFPEVRPGDYVMLVISDTGTGMSEKIKARIFEPFFSTKGVGKGTGLGLATCYGIIKQSGGHISVHTELGRGTTFRIYLPQGEQSPKTSEPRGEPPGLPRGTETILLVEDDPALREMAATFLGRLGYDMLTAAAGQEALNLASPPAGKRVDLLLTDLVMSHVNGTELARCIHAWHPHLKVLFTSGYAEHSQAEPGVTHEGVAVLQKPFPPTLLARRVREVLDEK